MDSRAVRRRKFHHLPISNVSHTSFFYPQASLTHQLWFHHTEMILHKPTRHEKRAFYVQSANILLDFCFAVEVFGARDLARKSSFVTLGSDDQIICVTLAATQASAIAFPWTISAVADACSQTESI